MNAIRFLAATLLGVSLAPGQLMRVMVAEVEPDRVLEFRDLQKKATAAYQKSGHAYRAVYAPGGIGNQNTWYGFTPLDKYAEFDNPPVEKAMGDNGYRDFLTQARSCVSGVRYEVVERRADLTIDEGPRPGSLYQVAHVRVKLGQEAAFEEKYKIVVSALKKAGVKTTLVSRVVMGRELGLYRIAIPMASYADFDKGPLVRRVMGEEAYGKWRASVADHLQSVVYEVVRLDPELSFRK
jgi:hypothetical protein